MKTKSCYCDDKVYCPSCANEPHGMTLRITKEQKVQLFHIRTDAGVFMSNPHLVGYILRQFLYFAEHRDSSAWANLERVLAVEPSFK